MWNSKPSNYDSDSDRGSLRLKSSAKLNEWFAEFASNHVNIDNQGGHLVCRPRPHADSAIPGGYLNSCEYCRVVGQDPNPSGKPDRGGSEGDLVCDSCGKSDGNRETETSGLKKKKLEKCLASTTSEIQNHDGSLVCGDKAETGFSWGWLTDWGAMKVLARETINALEVDE